MTLPSDDKHQKDLEDKVNSALDDSARTLPDNVRDDLYKARMVAMRALHNKNNPGSSGNKFKQWIAQPFPRAATGVACAVLVALSLGYGSVETVPALPIAMMTEDVPTENLSLLEDLEFVTWLAENEAQALL